MIILNFFDQAQGLFEIEMCSLQISKLKGVILDIISGIGHILYDSTHLCSPQFHPHIYKYRT